MAPTRRTRSDGGPAGAGAVPDRGTDRCSALEHSRSWRSARGHPALAQRAACHRGASFEQWLDAFKREAVTQGVSQRAIAAASHLMVYDQQVVNKDRGQKVFGADLPRILRPHGGEAPHRRRHPAHRQEPRAVPEGRAAVRRAGAGDRGVLGAGNRLRRLHGQSADDQVGHVARLRLPAARPVPHATARRAQDHRSRRSYARADDRPVRRRAWPVPVPARALFRLRRRL